VVTVRSERHRQFTYHLLYLITVIANNMLLVILLGLIAKLAMVSSKCDVGTSGVKDFDWNQVSFTVSTRLLKQAAFKTASVIPLTNT
jgi:hypothetical protein